MKLSQNSMAPDLSCRDASRSALIAGGSSRVSRAPANGVTESALSVQLPLFDHSPVSSPGALRPDGSPNGKESPWLKHQLCST